MSRLTLIAVGAALLAGVVFRLFYPGAIEYHINSDEKFSFDHVIAVLNGGPWPTLGMTMSIGGPNPGMSVWIFIILGLIGNPETPVGLAQCVQALNIVALAAFVAFILASIPRQEREPWLWGAALWAVNPLSIIYERKIWPPSTLPVFIVAMLAGWWHRRTFVGSFGFALASALGGQIHPTCAFLGFALYVWAAIADWRSFRYGGIAAGSVVGLLPAINWLATYTATQNALHQWRLPSAEFYRRWLTTPFGYGSDHTLGPVEFPRFLGWPEVDGASSYLALATYLAIVAVALGLLLPAAWRLLHAARTARSPLRWYLLGSGNGGLAVRAAFFGFGAILTVISARGGGLYPHYMIVVAPLMTLWIGLLAAYADGGVLRQRGRGLLAALCALDAAVVLLLFSYIHSVGDIHGEFGPSWEWQQEQSPPVVTPEP